MAIHQNSHPGGVSFWSSPPMISENDHETELSAYAPCSMDSIAVVFWQKRARTIFQWCLV